MCAEHERDQRGDSFVSLDWMPKRKIGSDLVAIPAAMANPLKVPCFFQVGDNPLDGALRDACEMSDISHPHLRLPRDAQEDVCMVGEKRPGRLSRRPSHRRLPCRRFLAAGASCSHLGHLLTGSPCVFSAFSSCGRATTYAKLYATWKS